MNLVTKYSFVYLYTNNCSINIKKLHIEKFKSSFNEAEFIMVSDIISFYRKFDDKVKTTTVSWRIYALVENGIIQRIGRGKYKLGRQMGFEPLVSIQYKHLYSRLKNEYPYLDICIWSTKWVAKWMLHIPSNYETIIEVEKGSEESVFYFLSNIRGNVFLNPSRSILNKYANTKKPIIIIKNLITDAPLQKIKQVQIPKIEKILVDLIVDVESYPTYQGRDLDSIIENAFQYNTINKDTLFRYAERRKKRPLVEKLINKNM